MPPNHQMQQQQGGQAQAMLQQSYPGDTGKENTAFVCFRIAFIVSILTGTVIYKGGPPQQQPMQPQMMMPQQPPRGPLPNGKHRLILLRSLFFLSFSFPF